MNSELQSLFKEASELQAQGKTQEALDLYNKITASKVTSTSLELNRALIYEQNKDWGLALTSIDKAQFLSRRPWLASDIKARLERKVLANRAYDTGTLSELYHHSEKVLRAQEALWLSALLLGALLIIKALGFKNNLARWCLVFSLLFLSYASLALFTSQSTYILHEAELRAVPLATTPVKTVLPVGTKVVINQRGSEFSKVERSNDFSGWISNSALEY